MNEMFYKKILFTTLRLTIRQLLPTDLIFFHEMQADFEVMKYATGKANSMEVNQSEFKKLSEAYKQPDNNFWVWAIADLDDNFLGTIALIKDKEQNNEIGFRLMKKKWGKGYASEAVAGLIDFAYSIPEIQNLVAYADLRNNRSQNVLNKNGFVNLGIKYNDSEDCEEYIYSINTSN